MTREDGRTTKVELEPLQISQVDANDGLAVSYKSPASERGLDDDQRETSDTSGLVFVNEGPRSRLPETDTRHPTVWHEAGGLFLPVLF
jgi:hypothetical protein